MRNLMMAVIMVVAMCSTAFGSLEDCMRATCRVNVSGGNESTIGTGCVYDNSTDDKVWILTCRHVASGGNRYTCDFWSEGRQFEPLSASLAFYVPGCDSAVLVIPKESFGANVPTAIPLGDTSPKVGEKIASVGCAKGAWATAWHGFVLRYDNNSREPSMQFLPSPADGRSGSAIFDGDGEKIVGVLFARVTSGIGQGLAVPIERLTGQFSRNQMQYIETAKRDAGPLVPIVKVQCGPQGCPPPQTFGGGYGGGLPYQQQPPAPSVSGTGESYLMPYRGRVDDRIDGLQGSIGNVPMPLPTGPMVDSYARDSISDLDRRVGAIEQSLSDVEQGIGSVEQGIGNVKETIGKADGLLPEKIKTFMAEKLPFTLGVIEKLGWGTVPLVAIVLGIIVFMIRKDVENKIKTGDPLLIEKIAALTPMKFDDRVASKLSDQLVRLHEKIDGAGDRIRSGVGAATGGGGEPSNSELAGLVKGLAAKVDMMGSGQVLRVPPTPGT